MVKHNVYVLSFSGWNDFIPVLWPSAKTHYELYGKYPEKYNWILPTVEFYRDIQEIKDEISKNPPSLFGVSLYVWNYEKSLAICRWVKETWPDCIVMTGGPHQYFKHHADWFKTHWFIDASLPSEVYGEIAITDILNNYENGKVKWNTVEQMVYPSKDKAMILRSPKATYKRDFVWNFSSFETQYKEIQQYSTVYYTKFPNGALHSKIETTRGCPYECTFCDWGGGVGTKVILKDLDCVKRDIDILLDCAPTSIYICDANFGINRDRDVAIVQYIADKKQESKDPNFPNVQYGGFAKTNKHFDTLKTIFTIEAENGLSQVYKISQQSFNDDILKNVKRTDLRANEHFELAEFMRTTYGYEATVELIMGLPGITTDIWYTEFDKPYEWNTLVRAYEWYLLPEAESFDSKYRNEFGVETAKKWFNREEYTIPSEVVVGGKSFTRDDYKEMMMTYTWYIFFMQSGVYKYTIKGILEKNQIKFGEFLKQFYNQCYPRLRAASLESFTNFENHLEAFVKDEVNETLHNITWKNDQGPDILHFVYFIMEYFKHFETLSPIFEDWLVNDMQGNAKKCRSESALIISEQRMGSVRYSFLSKVKYDLYQNEQEFIADILRSSQYTYGNLLLGSWSISIHPKSLWKIK
jgi:hypothetical protein